LEAVAVQRSRPYTVSRELRCSPCRERGSGTGVLKDAPEWRLPLRSDGVKARDGVRRSHDRFVVPVALRKDWITNSPSAHHGRRRGAGAFQLITGSPDKWASHPKPCALGSVAA